MPSSNAVNRHRTSQPEPDDSEEDILLRPLHDCMLVYGERGTVCAFDRFRLVDLQDTKRSHYYEACSGYKPSLSLSLSSPSSPSSVSLFCSTVALLIDSETSSRALYLSFLFRAALNSNVSHLVLLKPQAHFYRTSQKPTRCSMFFYVLIWFLSSSTSNCVSESLS